MPVSVISAKSFPVKGIMEKNIHVTNSAALCLPVRQCECWFLIRAVLLGDFLDGDAHLIAQVPPGVHHTVRPFT